MQEPRTACQPHTTPERHLLWLFWVPTKGEYSMPLKFCPLSLPHTSRESCLSYEETYPTQTWNGVRTMRWRTCVSFYTVIMSLTCLVPVVQAQPILNNRSNTIEPDTREVLYRDFLLSMLGPSIQQAIENHYGEHRSFALYQAQFKDIKRLCQKGQFYFEATLVVETWTGSKNPPYGLDTITLTNDPPMIGMTGRPIHILKYVHQDLPAAGGSRLPLRRNC